MTQQQSTPVTLAGTLGVHDAVASHLQALCKAQSDFEAARAALQRHVDEKAKYESARDAANLAAKEANAKIRGEFKVFGLTTREAVKLKAARNGHLEDAENFQMLVDDVDAVMKGAELAAYEAAHICKTTRSCVRSAAIKHLEGVLAEKLPVEFFMLVELLAETAASGESDLFNADPTIHTPIDFALRHVAHLVRALVPERNGQMGSAAIIPPAPEGLASYGNKSPVQLHLLRTQFAKGRLPRI